MNYIKKSLIVKYITIVGVYLTEKKKKKTDDASAQAKNTECKIEKKESEQPSRTKSMGRIPTKVPCLLPNKRVRKFQNSEYK